MPTCPPPPILPDAPLGTIWFLCGFIASGKSHLARHIEAERRAVILSADEWMLELFGPHMPREDLVCRLAALQSRFRTLAVRLTALGIDSVFDFGFWRHHERIEALEWARSAGVVARLVHCDTPKAVCRARAIARTEALSDLTDHYPIDGETFDTLWAFYEPPDASERFDLVVTSGER